MSDEPKADQTPSDHAADDAAPLALPAPEGRSLYLCNLTAQVQNLIFSAPGARPDAPPGRRLVVVQPYATDLVDGSLDGAGFDHHVAELRRFGGRRLDDLDPSVPPFGLVWSDEPIDLDALVDGVASRNAGHAEVISANRHRYAGGGEPAVAVTSSAPPFEG